jgi:hypothetical protein
MPEVPTTEGLPADERSLFRRWSIAKANNYVVENADGEKVKLKRVSKSTLRKRYRTGLNTFWTFLIGNSYVGDPLRISQANPSTIRRRSNATRSRRRSFSSS